MEVLYFTAKWCAPCKVFGPVMEKVGQDVPVQKVDIEEDMDKAVDYAVLSVPTVVIVENDKELGRFTGARTEDWVRGFINQTQYSD